VAVLLTNPQGSTLEAAFRYANQGFSVEGRAGNRHVDFRPTPTVNRIGYAFHDRISVPGRQAATRTMLDRENSPAFASSAAMRLAWRTAAPGAGMFTSGAIRGETVFVDDMKEVAHAAELGRRIAGFQ